MSRTLEYRTRRNSKFEGKQDEFSYEHDELQVTMIFTVMAKKQVETRLEYEAGNSKVMGWYEATKRKYTAAMFNTVATNHMGSFQFKHELIKIK